MKRVLSILMAIAMVITIMPAEILMTSAMTSGIYTYSVTNGMATITDCNSSASGAAITIPSKLGGYQVTAIGEWAFKYCNQLTGITIPGSVVDIGNAAFYCCGNLKRVTIPDSVTYIGSGAFNGCSSLPGITLPKSINTISPSIFVGCLSLAGILIPTNVTSIGDNAFSGCTGLKSVTMGSGVISIGLNAFKDCTCLTGIIIPESVVIIDPSAFSNCIGLKSVTIGNGVMSIGDHTFSGCTGLKSAIIGTSVLTIGSDLFDNCNSLANITMSDNVVSIGSGAFDDTMWYKNQPDGLIYAGKVAYRYKGTMPANTSIVLKADTLGIAGGAFDGCTGLTNITVPDGLMSIGGESFADTAWFNNQPDGLIYVGNVAACYKGTMPANTTITLKPDTIGIADGAFGEISELIKINIPDNVKFIGLCSFVSTGLTSVTIPEGVTIIGGEAFGNTDLTSAKIPNSVKIIGEYAFGHCSDLRNVTIGSGVVCIGSLSFYQCSALTSVTIPNTVKYMGMWAFGYSNEGTIMPGFSINCSAYSAGLTYAKDNGLKYYDPPTPGSPKAVSASYNSVKISWNAVSGATGYTVYRYNTSTKKYDNIKVTSATSYTDNGRTTGTEYTYKVKAYKTISGTTIYGNTTAVVKGKPVPATPGNVKAIRASSTSIKISWSDVTGATGYVLYKYNPTTKVYAQLKVLSATSYINTGLTKGVTYYYKVRAYKTVSGVNIYSNYSTIVSAKTS